MKKIEEKKEPLGVITFLDGTEKEFYYESELQEQEKPIAMIGYC